MTLADEKARVRREKLRWASRRALLELDLILERFWQRCPATIDPCLAERLERLLALEDNDLWEVFSGRRQLADPLLQATVALITEAAADSSSKHMTGNNS